MIYVDNAATTSVRKEAIEAMWPYMTGAFGNPSSPHEVGKIASAGLDDARAKVARIIGGRPNHITFTSGGTEANNLAIKGSCLANPRGRHLITTPIEHDSILETASYLERFHDFEITYLSPDRTGLVSPEQLCEVLRPDTTLVSIGYANNEVGTVQPIARLAQASTAPFHTDAVQAAHLPFDIGVDALSLSGHKFGAPKGTGMLWSKLPLEPVIHGGGQEKGRRSGTENVAGAVAFARALELTQEEHYPDLSEFITEVLRIPGATLTGHSQMRLDGHASFLFDGIGSETVLLELERHGIVCSPGSACGSGEVSHVLLALGFSEDQARTAVRCTFGTSHSREEIQFVATAIAEAVATVRGESLV
ncbi:cysteine sulfinate desulfinase [Corynebacterium suranareeae]|uniref:Cysteine sulfinate desulfinase n=1 Tax=Corynebacterium suranareeae TaxID=2506452 RepID=A0A169RUB6_9CORY|nr:cysteine desulfurase family protein [Corynebacterium suranareeae]BAU95448.1 cysteine sulfinate desulfinase [Corynebacterium suranareeae]